MGIQQQPILWSLTVKEGAKKGMRVVGQYIPEDLRRDVSTQYSERTAFSRPHPIAQWIAGTSQRIRFRTRFVRLSWAGLVKQVTASLDHETSLLKALKELEELILPDPKLGHPPRLSFSWGEVFKGVTVVLESLGGIQYDRLVPSTLGLGGGQPTVVTFEISLMQIYEYSIPSAPLPPGKGESLYYVSKGETYEQIAVQAYGDPDKGVILRQRNGGWNPRPGQVVFVPSASAMRKYKVGPRAIPLRNLKEVKRWILSARH